MRNKHRLTARAVVAGFALLTAGAALGQDYPNKPVRIITADVGSTNDLVVRLIAPGLAASLGQQVIVENRGGASGTIAAQMVAKSAPDGYTLLLYSNPLWVGPLLQGVSWDPAKDFAPITLAASSPNILVVHPSLPVKSVKELIALAKSRPGQLNYASSSSGSSNHLGAELFKAMARVDIVRINYKGGGAGLNAVIAGQVHLMFGTTGSAIPHVQSGRLRALATCSLEPSALTPGLPTVAASGLPGFESGSVYGTFAPARTAPAIINRLHQEIVKELGSPALREKFANLGIDPIGTSPAQLAAAIKSEMANMARLIKEAGIKGE